QMIDQWRPRVVFVDLSAGDLAGPAALLALTKAAPGTPFVAFGSHVDTASLAAAAASGCDPVLPRSRFSAELPELIRRYLGSERGEFGRGVPGQGAVPVAQVEIDPERGFRIAPDHFEDVLGPVFSQEEGRRMTEVSEGGRLPP